MADRSMATAMSRRSFLLRFTGAGTRAKDPAPKSTAGRVRLKILGVCLACGACARACPDKALRLSTEQQGFRLRFQPELCTDCGLCLKTCLAGCLVRIPDEASPGNDTPDILAEGPLFFCRRCRSATAVLNEGGYCRICARGG
ncbi:NADH-quinone oxidoreductase subunit I [Desulfolutivibrio sulfoxidireducens]|uniref:NADH-quinone oxidoreductase subunit I n=1 Tax=Desulfolutivibrio sulfoxidireducens TaxID=2773299 RepID=UPI00159D7F5A|nr:ferredoxin family protein [Desulfolutivibrio sulfoxidireducens]QLA18358.1 4Fe-4S dicluster domain-containing protein [Desulfolutivibrio sulfoxidireducens]